jgi:chromodomain-helicase-DNA-binding protein 4
MSRCTSSALSSAESAGQGASASEPLGVPDSEEPSSEEDNDSDFESNGFVELRRSTRAAPTGGQQKTVRQLPYSPVKATRKRRTRNAALLEDSEDELAGFAQDSDIEMAPVRRSQRTAKGVSRLTATAVSTDDESDQYEPVQRKKGPKNPHVPKASRPAYGHFRPITDLDQEDEDPLRAHRNYCEKCRQKPAHVLRKAYRKRPKNTKKQKRNDSTDDDGEDEDTNLANKGGWVRWQANQKNLT